MVLSAFCLERVLVETRLHAKDARQDNSCQSSYGGGAQQATTPWAMLLVALDNVLITPRLPFS